MSPHIKLVAPSGNDIGQEDIFELNDAILERQLSLFEALDQHAIGNMGGCQCIDRRVEIAVFLAFGRQFKTVRGFLFLGERHHDLERTQICPRSFLISVSIAALHMFSNEVVKGVDKA